MHDFRYPWLWLGIGWFGIALLIFLSLATLHVSTGIDNGDKLGHLLAYALLMGWFSMIFRSRGPWLGYALGLIVLGVLLECLQPLNGRYFEYADMLANTLGVGLGLLARYLPLGAWLLGLEQYMMKNLA